MGLLFFAMLVGGLAGFAAWGICEPSSPGLASTAAWLQWGSFFTTVLGALIGGAVGGLNGWYQGSKIHLLRGAALGLLIGAIGAIMGNGFGGALANTVTGGRLITAVEFPVAIVARTVYLVPIGAFIGAAIGASGLSWKRALVGALGGAVGGLIAGLTFDMIAKAVEPLMLAAKGGAPAMQGDIPIREAEIGGPSRAATSIFLGASIGLFTALFARLTRSAWIKLVLGRNEGKEWLVDAPQTFIGRSERAHVPLMGDMNVAPMHACIQKQGLNYTLVDGGAPIGTYVNGQRISHCPLFNGAVIQVGPYQLVFSLKSEAAKRAGEAAYRSQGNAASPGQPPGPPDPMPQYHANPASQATQVVTAVNAPVQNPTTPFQPSPTLTNPHGSVLVALDGPLVGQKFSISGATEVGREGGGIPLSFDTSVSRRHVRISMSPQGAEIEDLGSMNGTFVNGVRTTRTTIRPGDVVKIGVTSFRLE